MRMRVLILAAMMLVGAAAQAADLTGIATVIDGNTLAIGATKIRLERIDARDPIRSASMRKLYAGTAASRLVTNSRRISRAEK